jgi:hypothetical protein
MGKRHYTSVPNKPDDWRHPQWQNAQKVHDWRNHVCQEVRDAWLTFTPYQRAIVAANAKHEADNEEWE